jgi:hypothetical protein
MWEKPGKSHQSKGEMPTFAICVWRSVEKSNPLATAKRS